MNKQFFSQAYDGVTEGFLRPALDKIVSHPYTKEHVFECLKTIASSSQSRITRNCRLYHRGAQINVFEAKCIVERICRNYASLDQVDWDSIFGEGDFLFFINHAALYSVKLLAASRQFVGDFAERFEPGGLSIEHHLIIGRYKETPFGVHLDDPTDRVFHFNLGPSEKRMSLWPREAFIDDYKHDMARPIDQVSFDGSTTYNIPAGSCFFLPANYHHVGASDAGVSILVALAFSRQSESLLLAEALSEMREWIPERLSPHSYYRDFKGETYSPDVLLGAYDDFSLVAASQHARAKRKSNGSFTEVHPLIFSPVTELVGNYLLVEDRRPLPVKQGEIIYIYSAGHQAILATPALVSEFYDILRLGAFNIPPLSGYESTNFMQSVALRAWLVTTGSALLKES